MKRIIKLISVVLITAICFSSCNNQNDDTPVTTSTNELIIYIPPHMNERLIPVIRSFENKYDIKVTTTDFNDIENYEQYVKQVSTELMSGEGPDIIFPTTLATMDINKLMQDDIFLDLTNYIKQDDKLNMDDYVKVVMDTGVYNDKQFVIPISYSVPLILSSTKGLNNISFDWNNADNIVSFLEEISKATTLASQNAGFMQMMHSKFFIIYFLEYSGLKFIDYKNNTVCNEEEDIKSFFTAYKEYFPSDYDKSMMFYSTNQSYRELSSNAYYFYNHSVVEDIISNASVLKSDGGYTLSLLKDVNKKITSHITESVAVRANTKNHRNAYNFIKEMLSGSAQMLNKLTIPVNKSIIQKSAKKAQENNTSSIKNLPGYTSTELTDNEVNDIIDMVSNVETCTFENNVNNQLIYKTMLPFFLDEKDYDTCFNELKSKLTLYLSE